MRKNIKTTNLVKIDSIEFSQGVYNSAQDRHTASLYRDSDHPTLRGVTWDIANTVDIKLEFKLNLFDLILKNKTIQGASEDWMQELFVSSLRKHEKVVPMEVPSEMIKAITKGLTNILGEGRVQVTSSLGEIKVEATATAGNSPYMTLLDVSNELILVAIQTINKWLKKPSKMSRKRYTSLKEKLESWCKDGTPFSHFNGGIYSDAPDEIKLKTSPSGGFTEIVQRRRQIGNEFFLLIDWGWQGGRVKAKVISSLPAWGRFIPVQDIN